MTMNKVHVNIEALMNSDELELPNGLKMTRMGINPNRVNDKSAITFKVKYIAFLSYFCCSSINFIIKKIIIILIKFT
jgi:hypothetical protein